MHAVRSVRSALAPVLVAVALLAGCGGDDGDDAATTTTADPTATVRAELEAALLEPADLATGDELDAGWAVGDVSEGVDIELPECVVEEPGSGAVASAEAKLVTETDLKLPSVEQDVARYEGTGAADAFAAAAARLDGCTPVFVFQGTESPGTIERLPLTLPGAQAAAWRTSVTVAGTAVAITSIHVQEGDHELALVHVDLGKPDPTVLEDLAATAVAKLP